MKPLLLILALLLVAGATATGPSMASPVARPTCAQCVSPDMQNGCYANYGADCTPIPGFTHCTDAQAAAWCAGWGSTPPTTTPNCTICYGNGSACYANYGAACTPISGIDHCTVAEATAWCAGWAAIFATPETTP
jgi:hypothetical protein